MVPAPTTSTPPPALEPTARPRLGGRQRAGATLRVRRGTWPVTGLDWRYRWYADGHRLRGARHRALEVTPRLARSRLSVRVAVSREGYQPWRARLRVERSARSGKLPVD